MVHYNLIRMKLKQLFDINRDTELSSSWLSNQRLILLMLTLAGTAIVLLWQFFDRFYFETRDVRLTWLRIITVAVYAVNLLIARYRRTPKSIKQHLIAGFYLGTLFCMLLAMFTGASKSPYWFGLFFIIIAWFVLVPYNFTEMTLHSLVFLVIFISGQFAQTEYKIIGFDMAKMIFLYSGALLVSFFSAYIRNKLDAENILIKNKLKDNNDELLAINEELRSEIENHHQTTMQLVEKQLFIDNIISNAPMVIFSLDSNGVFTYSHGKALSAIGVNPGDNIGKSVFEVYKGTEAETFIRRVMEGEILGDIVKVGDIFYDTRVTPLINHFGENTGYMGVALDVTERFKIEKQLQKFKLVLDQAPGGVFIVDKNSRFEYLNPEFTRISGYTEEDLLNQNLNDTLYKGKVPESRKDIIATIAAGNKWQGELLTINKNGVTYWANTIAAPYKSENGEIDGFIVIQQDITRRKEMEIAIQEKEKLYRTLIEKSLDGVAISQGGKILLANQAFCDIIGYELEELLNTSPESLIAPEDRKMVLDLNDKRLKGEVNTSRYLAKFIHKTGKIIILDINAASVLWNGKNASFVTMRDITERAKIEDALRTSEDKYRKLFESEMDAIFLIDIEDGQILEANPAASEIYGYGHEELIKLKNTDLSAEPEKTYSAMKQKQTLVPIRRHRKKDGTVFTVELSAGFTIFEGRNVQIVTARDISYRIQMEKALRESEEKYRMLVENSQDGICITQDGDFKFVNQAMCKMLGYTAEEIYSMPGVEIITPENRDKVLKIHKNRMEGKVDFLTYNMELLAKDKTVVEVEAQSSTFNYEGKPAGFFTLHNITHRKKIQAALRESEKKYRELTEMLPQTVYELDMEGNITYMNQTGLSKFGIDQRHMGLPAFNFIMPGQHEMMRMNMKRSIENNYSTPGNSYTAIRLDGQQFPVMIFSSPLVVDERITGTRGIILDMTEHDAMEKALKESEEKYKNLIEKAEDGIIITQLGYFKFVNRAFCKMMQYSESELIGKPYLDYVINDDHEMMMEYHRRRMAGEEFQVIYRSKIIRKDGKILHVELNTRTSEYDGKPAAFIITRDITDRLKTEEELRSAKAELEALNNELEKRVMDSSRKLTEANTQLISLQKENLQSQFEVLRQQVNPHFLFNSLNVLTSLIKLEPDLAEKFTEHLSKVYRYVLENKDNDLVPVRTELEFLDAYIFLLNIRFMNKIEIKVDIEEQKKELLILPLALQLLIENAIKHNSMSRKMPLKIRIFIDESNTLNIVNNLQMRESHMVSTGVGLKNIEHRYKLLEMPMPEFYKTENEFVAKISLKN